MSEILFTFFVQFLSIFKSTFFLDKKKAQGCRISTTLLVKVKIFLDKILVIYPLSLNRNGVSTEEIGV